MTTPPPLDTATTDPHLAAARNERRIASVRLLHGDRVADRLAGVEA